MKQNARTYNELLFRFYRSKRKLANLQKSQRNTRRQGLLRKRIIQLYQKLMWLRYRVQVTAAAAVFALGLVALTPQVSQAQSFAAPQTNPFGLTTQGGNGYSAPAFVDLDGDGDMDILAGSYDGDLYYYQNTGTATSPSYASPQENPFGLTTVPGVSGSWETAYIAFVDLDNDGDMDLMAGNYYGEFWYYENTGTATAPNFAAPVFEPFGLSDLPQYYSAPSFADLDNDGDMDMMVGDGYGNLYYYENTGTATAPSFGSPQENHFGLTHIYYINLAPQFVDLDGDGDMDILEGTWDGTFFYFENTGSPTNPSFDSVQTNPFSLVAPPDRNSTVSVADIDGDGDLDMISGSENGDFYYYENQCASGNTINVNACDTYTSPSGKTWTSSGTYVDTLTNAAGCDSILVINLTVNTVNASVTQSGDDLVASPSGASYQWLDCDNSYAAVSGATNQTYTPPHTGHYAVAVTQNSCSDTSDCFVYTPTSINKVQQTNFYKVYPNPVTATMQIVSQEKLASVSVFTLTGRLLKTIKPTGDDATIDMSGYAQGVYLINVRALNGTTERSLVVKQ